MTTWRSGGDIDDDDGGGGGSSRSSSSSCWLERTTLSWGNLVPAAPSHPDPTTHMGVLGCSEEPCVGTALAETRMQPHTSPMRISLWVSRGGKGGASPVAHLSVPASPWPEILLKGAAEDRQPGWSMREGRYFYFEKA